jgi:hypothetical protein
MPGMNLLASLVDWKNLLLVQECSGDSKNFIRFGGFAAHCSRLQGIR